MKKNKKLPLYQKYFLIGFILLGVALFGKWYFSKQKINNNTSHSQALTEQIPSNWKSFSSQLNDISFQYPPNYSAPQDRTDYISILSPLNTTPQKGYEIRNDELKIEIYISASNENDSLEKWVLEEKTKSESSKLTESGKTTINGIPAAIVDAEGIGTARLYLVIHNGKRFMINKLPLDSTRNKEFNQILSTITFQ